MSPGWAGMLQARECAVRVEAGDAPTGKRSLRTRQRWCLPEKGAAIPEESVPLSPGKRDRIPQATASAVRDRRYRPLQV